jgi:hypothetical protein
VIEEWRDIADWPYRVSNLGNVYSERARKVLKPKRDRGGYLIVGLRHNGRRTMQSVHRLVCAAFHGPAPEGKPVARHLDGTRDNNAAPNLAWGSALDNEADTRRMDRKPRGERNPRAKLTDEQIAEIRRRHKAAKGPNGYVPSGFNPKLAAEFGIHVGTLNGLVAPNPSLETDRPLRRYYSDAAMRRIRERTKVTP